MGLKVPQCTWDRLTIPHTSSPRVHDCCHGGPAACRFGSCNKQFTVNVLIQTSLLWSRISLHEYVQVMVAGSEATVEYRVQVYTPAYLLTENSRPIIVRAPNLIAPGSRFPIQFSGVPSIDRVVLSRLPGVTHSVHMDARQLVLNCATTVSGSSSGITCQAPPDFTVAPPGAYLLFILSWGVPSRGQV